MNISSSLVSSGYVHVIYCFKNMLVTFSAIGVAKLFCLVSFWQEVRAQEQLPKWGAESTLPLPLHVLPPLCWGATMVGPKFAPPSECLMAGLGAVEQFGSTHTSLATPWQ